MLTRVLRIILVIVPEHPSDTYVLTMKMEILLEPASNKLLVGDSLNLPDHRIHKDGDGDALFQLKSDSLPHAHAQTTKTYYKHQDSRIMKAQELKTKTSAQTLIYKIFLQRYQVYQGRLLASFQDDAKYEHVGQDTRSQGSDKINVDKMNIDNRNPDLRNVDIYDPRNWDGLTSDMIKDLVAGGPKRDSSFIKGPKDKFSRRFSATLFTRVLPNNEKCDRECNGNFLGLIEMLEEFDPFIKEHVRRITSDEIHVHYLGHSIQNELIQLLALGIRSQIIQKIKQAKYFSVILDCTPDTSHQEQMSLILRYVNVSSTCVSVEESFLGFLNVNDTTGQGLFDVTQDELKSLDLDIDDVRGQGYDNGSNMKALVSKLWTFLELYNVFTLFLPILPTRWESRVESVKAIRYQLSEIREALLQVAETDNDSKIKSESTSLATNELGD
ncbi:zinc finger MYM-type protein 1, partial [Tanacetum coccineum]